MNLNRKLGQKKKALRHYRNVGLGFKTPREVCLFHVFACWWLVAGGCLAGDGRELIACFHFTGNWMILPDLGWTGVVGYGIVSGL